MPTISFKELTLATWKDFEQLFGERGACGGCWCMYWRLRNKEFEAQKGSYNKKAMKELAKASAQIGIIMYLDLEPIGWCSVAPRENFIRLENSKILKPVDDKKVWSIVCCFIDKKYRRKGYSVEMLKGVISCAKERGVEILEAYPHEPKKKNMPPVFAWTGISSAFLSAGFEEVIRRSETRPIMRYFF
jgi:GNAT superfamily N-acetyltransferase